MEDSASVGNADLSGDDDEQETSNSTGNNVKKVYHRHTPHQINRLETFFRECPHPSDSQRRRLSRELFLETKQIKFWFQNKRTQNKTQLERLDNSALRADNERLQCENFAVREALKNVVCPTCGGPPFASDERQNSIQMLQLENSRLKQEYGRLANILTTHFEKPIETILEMYPASELLSSSGTTMCNADNFNGSSVNQGLNPIARNYVPILQRPRPLISDMESALMVETAATALDELIRLLRMNEPLWFKLTPNDRLIIHRDSYSKIFPRAFHFQSPTARIESSKDYGLLTIGGINLVETFLDPNKWADLFPSIVTKASTLFVVESGSIGNRGGVLQLMHQQMHILSPLVSPREFYFLRYCQQIESGIWVIVDVSYDNPRDGTFRPLCWKLPSGCMIQDLPNGCTKVTWVEHVEVDDKTESHLYKDVISDGCGYGAELWISTLQRMCQRITSYTGEAGFSCEEPTGEGRQGLMRLSHRMVKSFCSILSMSDKLDIPEVNISGIRLSVQKNTGPGKPVGTIVAAAASLWLPIPSHNVFSFLQNLTYRTQWDVLSNRNQMLEVVHISNGAHLGNCISVIKPYVPSENAMMILQETTIDQTGSMIVYAPIDIASINSTIDGNDSSNICILPSGFAICGDGRPNSDGDGSVNSRGSLLTVAVQILVSNTTSGSTPVSMESVTTVTNIISSTIQGIKRALNCSAVV